MDKNLNYFWCPGFSILPNSGNFLAEKSNFMKSTISSIKCRTDPSVLNKVFKLSESMPSSSDSINNNILLTSANDDSAVATAAIVVAAGALAFGAYKWFTGRPNQQNQ